MHQVQMNYEVKIGQTNRFLYKLQSNRDRKKEEAAYTQPTTPQDHSREQERSRLTN
jgi:hypothetical protein